MPESMLASFPVLIPDSFWYSSQWMQGLDQEMPGSGFMGDRLKAAVEAGNVTVAKARGTTPPPVPAAREHTRDA